MEKDFDLPWILSRRILRWRLAPPFPRPWRKNKLDFKFWTKNSRRTLPPLPRPDIVIYREEGGLSWVELSWVVTAGRWVRKRQNIRADLYKFGMWLCHFWMFTVISAFLDHVRQSCRVYINKAKRQLCRSSSPFNYNSHLHHSQLNPLYSQWPVLSRLLVNLLEVSVF